MARQKAQTKGTAIQRPGRNLVKVKFSTELHGWSEGMQAEGFFKGQREFPRADGKTGHCFDLMNEDGELFAWGCPALLQRQLMAVPLNSFVVIVCTGQLPSKVKGRNPAWTFDVYTDEPED